MLREFLARPAHVVAPELLGCRVTRSSADGVVTVEITEVEAYEGDADPASHAHRGQTARNAVMFGEPGHLYVYRSYGIHLCGNVVTGTAGHASGVLLRSGRVVEGVPLARARRGGSVSDRALARGPGCLGQALGLEADDVGRDLFGAGPVSLSRGTPVDLADVSAGPRVGVRLAHDVPWRFWVAGDPTVSVYRRSPRAL